jgi:putative hydrolase of the HAD superfamily
VIQAVVSDFGGVLTAPLAEGFAWMQEERGVSLDTLRDAMHRATAAAGGVNPLFELETGAITEAEFLAALEAQLLVLLGRPVALAGFGERYMTALGANQPLFDHYRALRDRGLRLAMLTNNVREWEPHWRARLPIDELFELVVDSGFVGVRKPDHAIYRIVLERLALPAGACAFVDDLEHNVVAARELGFHAIHFRDTGQAIAELDALVTGA